ncbi:MAG: DUF1569 domain-containing protein [Phycisphaeraceae bacterium]
MTKPTRARQLHFDTLDDVLAEARRIAEHPDAPTRGAWSASQNIWHVARYLQASVEGYPFKVPWWMKLVGPLMKHRMTSKPMASGFNAPRSVAEHMEPQNVDPSLTTMDRSLGLLETWVAKANEQGFIPRNPAFGTMTTQQWIDLHCRHAELHLGLIEIND